MTKLRLQYRLRTLMALMLVVAVTLGWWLQPYTIEKRGADGQLEAQYRVLRGLLGGEVAHGRQIEYLNGKKWVRWMQWGGEPDGLADTAYAVEFYLPDGTMTDDPFPPLIDLIEQTVEPTTGHLYDPDEIVTEPPPCEP